MARVAAIREPALRLLGPWLAALVLCAAPASAATLRFWAGDSPRPALCLELRPGQSFQLEHRNSIYDATVCETYLLDQANRLIEVELASPSAGVFEYYGFDPPRAGRVALHQEVTTIHLRSMSYQHHLLRLGGRTIRLEELAQPGQSLRMEVDRP